MPAQRSKSDFTTDALMKRLVINALDFLVRAIDEFQEFPKYSIIHFSAAVEQFLKARLMAEHWTLVVSVRQRADWNNFISGNFQSVTLDEAASILEKVVLSELPKNALAAFRTIAKHRNRAIHFFHSAHTDVQAKDELRKIAKEQLIAWFHLHRLLQNQWSEIFSAWLSEINLIENKLKVYRDFLSLVFEEAAPILEKHRHAGISIELCKACSFESMVYDIEPDLLDAASCEVCGHSVSCITIECPSCDEHARFEEDGFGKCKKCNMHLEPKHLADTLEDKNAVYELAKEGVEPRGNCWDCDCLQSVIRVSSGGWLATCCLVEHEVLETCDWCGTNNTGDMANSFLEGCNMCGGHADWTKDD